MTHSTLSSSSHLSARQLMRQYTAPATQMLGGGLLGVTLFIVMLGHATEVLWMDPRLMVSGVILGVGLWGMGVAADSSATFLDMVGQHPTSTLKLLGQALLFWALVGGGLLGVMTRPVVQPLLLVAAGLGGVGLWALAGYLQNKLA